MSLVPFLTPLNYGTETTSFFQSLQNFTENYFSLGGNVVVIQPDGITALYDTYTPSYLESTLKVISYTTLVIPLIVLVGKIGLRLYFCPVVWIQFDSSDITDIQLLPQPNHQLKNILGRLFQEKANQLFWMPHPDFEESDLVRFPDHRLNFGDVFTRRQQQAFLGTVAMRELFLTPGNGGNQFLKWLNGEISVIDQDQFFNCNQNCFMNCIDFVYLALYQGGLISKEQIASIYRRQIRNILNEVEPNTFYGFDLTAFKDFDPQNGAEKENPKPGDLLIGFQNGLPVHILFLSGKNLSSGQWKGAALWTTIGNRTPTPCDVELNELQKDLNMFIDNPQPLTFKYCSLETALAGLNIANVENSTFGNFMRRLRSFIPGFSR